ncbi:hypothetical protein BD779DRAFT_1544025 [Infundibulicybe gibba]|nr:hypothetical protein BD779DRAFT_1544025 [Infundibulicybe gibba]
MQGGKCGSAPPPQNPTASQFNMDPQCSALAAAKTKAGLSYAQIGEKIGKSEQHVTDICTGKVKPTQAEFDELARALNITAPLPHDSAHSAK